MAIALRGPVYPLEAPHFPVDFEAPPVRRGPEQRTTPMQPLRYVERDLVSPRGEIVRVRVPVFGPPPLEYVLHGIRRRPNGDPEMRHR